MVSNQKFLMIGPQVFSQLYGKNQINVVINLILGLFVMDQSMPFGLKI